MAKFASIMPTTLALCMIVAAGRSFAESGAENAEIQLAQGLGIVNEVATSQPAARDVEVAQRLLNRLGLFDRPANGRLDNGTARALEAFQRSINVQVSQNITPELLRQLRRAAWQKGGWGSGSAKQQDAVLPAAGIREAQAILAQLGFEPGPQDGTFGPQTQAAVESFQVSQDVTIDGLVTRTSLANLKRAAKRPVSEMKGTLRLLNWPDYIDPTVVEDFERETNIRVIYDIFNSYDELEGRVTEGRARADIIVPGGVLLNSLIKSGKLMEVDKSKLTNLGNVDSAVARYLNIYDNGNKFSIPYVWWTSGLVYDEDKVRHILPNARLDSLALVLEKENVSKLAACGIVVNDTPEELIPAILAYMHEDIGTSNPEVLRKTRVILDQIKNYVRVIPNSEYIDTMANGRACASIGFSGDAYQVKLSDNGGKRKIVYRLPAEGGQISFDALAIPKDAANVNAAHAFLNFILRPDVIAKITNYTGYGNGNAASKQFIKPEIIRNEIIYPDSERLRSLVARPPATAEGRAELDRLWAKFK